MIEIAKIVKPQGIKGEVKALPSTNVLSVFNVLTEALVGNKIMQIQHISVRQGFLYIKFEGVDSRNDAELLRNQLVKIDKKLLEEAKDEDDFLVDDLIGMVIFDDKGSLVGQIIEIVNYGASDIVIVEKEGRNYEIPFVEGVFSAKDGVLVANSKRLEEVMI